MTSAHCAVFFAARSGNTLFVLIKLALAFGMASCIAIAPAQTFGASKTKEGIELEVVLVIASTKGMQPYFGSTLDAIADFVRSLADSDEGEVRESSRIGSLFYRDRKTGTDCGLDYITQWRVPVAENAGSETIGAVLSALASEHKARCRSDDPQAAMFDAVNRALLDPAWHDGSFRIVVVIGDADPHSDTSYATYEQNNPLHLTNKHLQELADQKNIWFITNRIAAPPEAASEFEPLSLRRADCLIGRFNRIPADPAQVRHTLAAALRKEWSEIILPGAAAEGEAMT